MRHLSLEFLWIVLIRGTNRELNKGIADFKEWYITMVKAYFLIQEATPLVPEPGTPIPYVSTTNPELGMEIESSKMSFHYPDSANTVLKNLNFKIKPGQVSFFCHQVGFR